MQIKVISVPVVGGEAENEELNKLLGSKKVIELKQELVVTGGEARWCFCVKYVDDYSPYPKKAKVDYREVLDPASFARFAQMRQTRKRVAAEEGVRPYVVFTDAELAELAQHETLSREDMLQVKGIGEKKVERYGDHFISTPTDEKSQSPDPADR